MQEFVSLYKDVLKIKTHREVDLKGSTRLNVTDTRQRKRLPLFHRHLDKIKEIFVYDHHPKTSDDLPARLEVVEQVGATTTILVERIFREGISLTAFEATLFVLGIFEDTGCLTFDITTARDVKAVYDLWQAGIDSRILGTFLRRPLNLEQRNLFDQLLSATAYHEIQDLQIGIAALENEEYVTDWAPWPKNYWKLRMWMLSCRSGHGEKIYLGGRSRTRALIWRHF